MSEHGLQLRVLMPQSLILVTDAISVVEDKGALQTH